MLGRWKNYEELEESLTLEELMETINAISKKQNSEREFLAAIQGVEIEGGGQSSAPSRDITTLSGREAAKAGFGIGINLGYESIGLD